MERKIYQDLINWKNSEDRKPLVLQGARQVGKNIYSKLIRCRKLCQCCLLQL